MNKGQALSGDFIVSIAVFMIILAFLLPAFDRLSNQVVQDEERREMETLSLFATDAMLKTQGLPSEWNDTNVLALGIANTNRKLNITKIRYLTDLDYNKARNLLDLSGFDFNLSFNDAEGYIIMTGIARSPAAYFYVQKNDLKNKIRNSGIAWDLYYGGSGTPDSADARNVYSDSKSNAFNMLVANSTIYKTVIIEDPQLQQGDVNIQGLKDFVASGGLLIFAGPADLIGSGFSMHSASYANANGIVASSDDILDANKNDAVTFFNPSSYFFNQTGDSYLKAIIADQQNALIGKWNHGLGSIYYMTSVNGTVNGNSLYAALNIAGKKAEIGTALNQAKSISSTNRFSVIDERNQIVQISLLVWK